MPATVGVPLTVQPVRDKPADKVPAVKTQLYGDVPPVAPMGAAYATPTVPFGKDVVVNASGAGLIVMLSGPLTVLPLLSIAFTVRFAVPATMGVPLTVQPLRDKPAGKVPAVKTQL